MSASHSQAVASRRSIRRSWPRAKRRGGPYFAGDVKTLGDLLAAEFIGIGMNDASVRGSRQRPSRARARFANAGGRLVRLAFPETRATAVRRCGRALWALRSRDRVGRRRADAARSAHRDVRPARREVGAPGLASRPDCRGFPHLVERLSCQRRGSWPGLQQRPWSRGPVERDVIVFAQSRQEKGGRG